MRIITFPSGIYCFHPPPLLLYALETELFLTACECQFSRIHSHSAPGLSTPDALSPTRFYWKRNNMSCPNGAGSPSTNVLLQGVRPPEQKVDSPLTCGQSPRDSRSSPQEGLRNSKPVENSVCSKQERQVCSQNEFWHLEML